MRRALAGVVALVLLAPGAAFGHATMKRSLPREQSRVETAPTEVRLWFDQSVTITPRAIEVFAADGTKVSKAAVLSARGRSVSVPLRPRLARGAYTVRWRELSADGHVGSGVFTFGLGVAAPPPTEAVGASGLTWKDDLARWGYFAALALLLGTLATRLFLLPRDVAPRLASRLYLVAGVAVFAALDIGVIAFVLRGANVLQVSFLDLLYGDLSPLADATRYGEMFKATTFGFAVVAALVTLAWVFDRTLLLWPALLLGAALVAGAPLSGHQATEWNASWHAELADWTHLLAASLWAGGLAVVATCVWPLAPERRRAVFVRFSRFATVLVGVIVLAGTYLGILRLPELSDLWSTYYGRVLLLKLALVSLAFAWGGLHGLVVRPRLDRGETPRGLGRSLLGESAVAMAVLLVAAALVNTPPPPEPEGDGGGAAPASAPAPG
jgi:copper transport protein